jgi:hypothetical protein
MESYSNWREVGVSALILEIKRMASRSLPYEEILRLMKIYI